MTKVAILNFNQGNRASDSSVNAAAGYLTTNSENINAFINDIPDLREVVSVQITTVFMPAGTAVGDGPNQNHTILITYTTK